jgi:cell division protein FtsB
MQPKGRHLVLLWLVVFLAVAAVVNARQTRAYALAKRLSEISNRRDALEAEVAELQRRIQHGSSRPVLGRRAEALGFHVAAGEEIDLLPLPADTDP